MAKLVNPSIQKIIELDMKDKKLLFELSKNARENISKIAKEIGCSKQTTKYRLDKLIKLKLITNFITIINIEKLNYGFYNLYLKVDRINKKREIKFCNFMKNYGLINQVVSGHGGFNYIVTLLAKNNKEFNKNSLKIFSKVGGSLRNYALFIVTDVYYAPHKYLFENKQFKQRKYGYEKQTKDVKYKKIDLKILSELSENARITNMELAKKFKISRSQVKYKIDRMEKFGLIQAYQPVLNTGKLGYEWFNLCFNIKNISKEEEKKFINFLKSMPSVNYIAKGIGRWNLVLGIHIKGMQQSHTIKDKIISEFPKIIRSYEYTYITKEHKCNFFPQAIFSKS